MIYHYQSCYVPEAILAEARNLQLFREHYSRVTKYWLCHENVGMGFSGYPVRGIFGDSFEQSYLGSEAAYLRWEVNFLCDFDKHGQQGLFAVLRCDHDG